MVSITIEENLSKRINSLRFLLIVFVVIIHNGISAKTFEERKIAAIIPAYVDNIQRFIGIITAIAVPLFFLFSAYFLYVKEQEYTSLLKKKCKTILLPYFLWHIVLIGIYFAVSTLPYTKHLFTSRKPIPSWDLLDWIKAFFGDYSSNETNYPFIYQFWFLRDLFILNILSAIIKMLVNKFPLGTLVLFSIFWLNNIRIYVVSPEALIFFVLGCYVVKYKLGIKDIDQINILDLFVIYFITIVLEYFFIQTMPVLHKINILIGCIFFIKMSQYFVENKGLYKILAWLEKYQFIVYAIHGVIIPQLLKIYISIIPLNGVYILLGYFIMILFGVSLSLIFGILLKELFPKIYGILTGGRI